jgi:hypothetical protein
VVVLVATAAVVSAVSLYALSLAGAVPGGDRDRASPALRRVTAAVTDDGAVRPDALANATDALPAGHEGRVELRVDGQTRAVGPPAPPSASSASRPVAVRLAPGRVRPGRLEVWLWS